MYPRSPFSISSQWGESCSKPPDTRHTLRAKANGPRFFFFHPYIARVVSVLRDSPVTDTRWHIHDSISTTRKVSFRRSPFFSSFVPFVNNFLNVCLCRGACLVLYVFLIIVPLLHVSILTDRSTKAETYFAGICIPSIEFESKALDNSDCLVCQKRDQVVINENIKRNARVRVADSLTMTRRRPPRSDSNWIYLLIWLLWIVLPIKTGTMLMTFTL